MEYMEVSGNNRDPAFCSDDLCPCDPFGVPIPRGGGYVYISKEVANFRKDCLSEEELDQKLKHLDESIRKKLDDNVVIHRAAGTVAPILICEEGAKKRGLDLEVAATDAKHWWETGKVPCRPTPYQSETDRQQLIDSFRKDTSNESVNHAIVRCPQKDCSQRLRIPFIEKTIIVSCPCGMKFDCRRGMVEIYEDSKRLRLSSNRVEYDSCSIKNPSGELVGLWFDMPSESITETHIKAALTVRKSELKLTKDEQLIHWITVSLGSYRVLNNEYDASGGSFVVFNPELAPGESVPLVTNNVWQESNLNPVTFDARQVSPLLRYSCPNCNIPISVNLSDIDDHAGLSSMCTNCDAFSFISGIFKKEPPPTDVGVVGSVVVPIADFSNWFLNHPVTQRIHQSGISDVVHFNFGVRVFCCNCFYQYLNSVMSAFITVQTTGAKFNAKYEESEEQMEALKAGHCPECRDDRLMAMMLDIPIDRILELESLDQTREN